MQTHAPRAARQRDLAAIAAAAALWGTSGATGQLLADHSDLSPLAVGFLRCALAAVILTGLRAASRPVWVRSPRHAQEYAPSQGLRVAAGGPRGSHTWWRGGVARADLARVLAVGAGLALYQSCYFAAVARAGVSVATLVTLGLAPVLVAVTSALLGHERPDRGVLIALLVALAGLALLVSSRGGTAADGGASAVGSLLAAGSAAGYAGVTLVSRSLAGRVEASDLTLTGFAVAAVLLAPLALAGGLALPSAPTTWGLLLYLGAVPTALAYRLFFAGLRTIRPTVASILTLVEPLTANLLAAIALNERLSPAGLLGGGLLLAAVVVLARPAQGGDVAGRSHLGRGGS